MEPNEAAPTAEATPPAPDVAAGPEVKPDHVVEAQPEPGPTPEEAAALAEYDADTLSIINEMADEVKVAEDLHLSLKNRAAEQKKIFEGMQAELRQLITRRKADRGRKPRQPTLFDGAAKATVDAAAIGVEPAGDDLWRQYPIERWTTFGLTAKDVEKLHAGDVKDGAAHPIRTVGDLNVFITPNPAAPSFARKLADIRGIGEKAADRIGEAETNFWGWWNKGGEAEFRKETYGEVAGGGEQPADAVPGRDDAAAPEGAEPGAAA